MAFARIITCSHQYAQQLALDLLARGYAVEIVSPDAVPNTPADLELRVEGEGSETQGHITEIREGTRARSIEYLQRLKPMMADLLRRWPGEKSTQRNKTENAGFSFNAEPESLGDMELPALQQQREPEPPQIAAEAEFESARLVSPPKSRHSEAFSITGEPLLWDESEPGRDDGSEVWFWRAAVGFACAALIILVLGMALRHNPSTPAQSASKPATPPLTAKAQPSPAKPAPLLATAGPATLPVKPAVVASAAPAPANLPKAKPSAAVHRSKVVRSDAADNGDTTVRYFNVKAPEPTKSSEAKQGSGIKHYSDLN